MKEKIPINQRKVTEAIQEMKTSHFAEKLSGKNLPMEIANASLYYLSQGEEVLFTRTEEILARSVQAMEQFFAEPGDIVIPYSGGRDSTFLVYLASLLFPDRTIHALTALTGFSKNHLNPRIHLEEMLNTAETERGSNIVHQYVDLSTISKDFILK